MFLNFIFYFFIFLLGLCIGSFLNCFIYRLEHKKNLSGRSFCPHCKHTLIWKDLIPVFSFLFLGGRCRYCKKKISIQYPAVEMLTGLIFVIIFNFQFSIFNQFTIYQFINLFFLFYVASVLIIIFIYDLKHYLIPDKVLLPAIALTAVYRLFDITHFLNYFSAALVASAFFFIIFFISQGKWMGFGDVKLAILMGLFLGFKNVLAALFLAFSLGAIIGLIAIVSKKKKLKSEIPFAPFLIAGTFLSLIWGERLINWYINIFQI